MSSKIHLVLGPGGIRSLAAVGVQRALEEAGMSVVSTAGCSAGALIGSLMASGMTSAQIDAELYSADLGRIAGKKRLPPFCFFLPPFSRYRSSGFPSFFAGLIEKQLNIQNPSLANLPLPFASAAVDLSSLSTVVFSSISPSTQDTNLLEVLDTSVTVPGLFPVREKNGRMLVDGAFATQLSLALLSNAREDEEAVPCVVTTHPPQGFSQSSIVGLYDRTIEASLASHDRLVYRYLTTSGTHRILRPVLWVNVVCPNVSFKDFGIDQQRKRGLFDAGYEAAIDALSTWESSWYSRGPSETHTTLTPTILIGNISIGGQAVTSSGDTFNFYGDNPIVFARSLVSNNTFNMITALAREYPGVTQDADFMHDLKEAMTAPPQSRIDKIKGLAEKAASKGVKFAEFLDKLRKILDASEGFTG